MFLLWRTFFHYHRDPSIACILDSCRRHTAPVSSRSNRLPHAMSHRFRENITTSFLCHPNSILLYHVTRTQPPISNGYYLKKIANLPFYLHVVEKRKIIPSPNLLSHLLLLFFYVSQNYSNYFQIYLAQKFHPPRLNNRNSISPDIIFQTFSPQFPSQYFTPFRSFKLQNNFFFSKTIFLLCCDINTYSTRTHTTILMHFADGFPPSPPLLSLFPSFDRCAVLSIHGQLEGG